MKQVKRSLHILADFYGCEGEGKYFTGKAAVRKKALTLIRRAGFSIIASRFHKFSVNPHDDGGITGVIIVSESHLTIHTWPEKRYVNLDVFFCNYSRDNTKKARAVFAEFKKIYKPQRLRIREVWRD